MESALPIEHPDLCRFDDKFLQRRPEETFRYLVFDAPNIMHQAASFMQREPENNYMDEKAKRWGMKLELTEANEPPNVYGLLSLMRYFVFHDFDVVTFIPHKYTLPFATNFPHAIEALLESELAQICETNHYDDTLCIETAVRTNGTILSRDLFRDEKLREERLRHLLNGTNTVGYDFSRNLKWANTGRLLKHFKFDLWTKDYSGGGKNRTSDRDLLHSKFFACEGDDRYELSYEVREGWTREWRHEMLQLLDHLLCYSQQLFDKEHPEDDKESIEIFKSGFDEQNNSEDKEFTQEEVEAAKKRIREEEEEDWVNPMNVTLIGGPPWGVRLGPQEGTGRPIITRILPGGRADVEGVKLGDLVETINGEVVIGCEEAHTKMQAVNGQMKLRLHRIEGDFSRLQQQLYFPLQTGAPFLGGPIQLSRMARSESSFGYESAAGDFAGGVKSRTASSEDMAFRDDQREDFDEKTLTEDHPQVTGQQMHKSAQAKTATMSSYPAQTNSASATSASLPFYQTQSTANQQTFYGQNNGNGIQSQPRVFNPTTTPGPSSWPIRTQTYNDQTAEGDVEVPHRRSVASLRQAITDKLEMKSPNNNFGNRMRNRDTYEPTPPPWAKSVKVHEFNGIDENKPYLGKVLDGPVAPEKYFQGVLPPSQTVVHYKGQVVQPPIPQTPPKSTQPRPTSTIRIQPTVTTMPVNREPNGQVTQPNQSNQPPPPTPSHRPVPFNPSTSTYIVPYTSTSSVNASAHNSATTMTTFANGNGPAMTQSFPSPSSSSSVVPSPRPSILSVQQGDLHYSYSLNDPRIIALEDLDDAASMISSSFSAFGDSSEVAGFTTPATVQQKQAGQMNATQEEQKSETQKAPTNNSEQVAEKQTTNGNGNGVQKEEEEEEVKLPPSSLFAQDIILTPFGKLNEPVVQPPTEQKTDNAAAAAAESKDGGSAVPPVPLQRGSSNGSMDLESSELLLKSRSPAPFSAYSSASPDHIGTIRKRQHSPVKLNLNDTTSSSEAISPAAPIDGRSNDSGYEGSAMRSPPQQQKTFDGQSVNGSSGLCEAQSSGNVTQSDSRMDFSSRPDSFLSTSTFETTEDAAKSPPNADLNGSSSSFAAALRSVPQSDANFAPRSNLDEQWSAKSTVSAQIPSGEGSNTFELQSMQTEIENLAHILAEDSDKKAKAEGQEDMTQWYKSMFNKMHRIDPHFDDPSVLRYQQRRDGFTHPSAQSEPLSQSQLHSSTRPLTPSTHVTQPTRIEVEVTPRRARSVGRVIEPQEATGAKPGPSSASTLSNISSIIPNSSPNNSPSPNLFALERLRTTHFHLPSYKFRFDSTRPIRCTSSACGYSPHCQTSSLSPLPPGGRCARCGRPTKDPTFEEIEQVYEQMARNSIAKRKGRLEATVALQCMSERLDATAAELEQFIERLEECAWRRNGRSKSEYSFRPFPQSTNKNPLTFTSRDRQPFLPIHRNDERPTFEVLRPSPIGKRTRKISIKINKK
ncbi:hypothetical protein WR25_15594 isoform D [Diploscapter pachys]|uniref:PDZ domain-containing protein n=1 Tax=Diploscapter pachys TaxID=2018661 RepID=A0A2A2L148_9BILA|nr:hypothetical protein WR25_15594 isoform A [Diploscapter pachys]PAV79970.1 hypothetical protein WR25_15594 isoform B [Diploscapter pachys]PAV79971.1 hypothetical protein WR25_15594 isoform C [Diploscapter pachys]PAV79972.1 hypothetical protein WR25_15594 isoform D [Diploscapter pachys]